jgi:hypothetical protein
MNNNGMKTAINETVIDTIVKPISAEPFSRGQRVVAVLEVAEDILPHDDRIVDDKTNGQCQRHQ